MNPVPHRYRNVINPWMTPKEIRRSVAFIESMLLKLGMCYQDEDELLRTFQVDRNWAKPQ